MHVQNNLIFGGLSRLERSICILLEGFLVRLASSGTVRQGEHNNSCKKVDEYDKANYVSLSQILLL